MASLRDKDKRKAKSLLEIALAHAAEVYGEDHPLCRFSRSALAQLAKDMQREPRSQQALEARKREAGEL